MSTQSLEEAIEAAGGPREALTTVRSFPWPSEPGEYTNWIEEQRSWRETCALRNHTPANHTFRFEGPDALKLLTDFGVNDLTDFSIGQAKQYVACNPDGYLIGDSILFRLGDDRYGLTGIPEVANWLRYNLEAGDYEATANFDDAYRQSAKLNQRDFFRYSIQGPNAVNVMQEAVDGSLPSVPFFRFDDVTINGKAVTLFHHGMAGEKGFEFWGSFEYADEIWNTVVDAGEEFGLRCLGNRSYQCMAVETGWIAGVLPAIFGDDERLKGYREWIDARTFKRVWSPGGSFTSNSIDDYYIEPAEIGYGRLVDFGHDFMGKEALERKNDEPRRQKVTLVWNDEDVVEVYQSLFGEGPTNRYMDFPELWTTLSYFDDVTHDSDTVGVSKFAGYTYNERSVLSLAILEQDYVEPGTEVSVVWGESRKTQNPAIESHEPTEIQATVAQVPFVRDQHGRGQ